MSSWFTAGHARLLDGSLTLFGRRIGVSVGWMTPEAWGRIDTILDTSVRAWALGAFCERDRAHDEWSAYLRLLGLEVTLLRLPKKEGADG